MNGAPISNDSRLPALDFLRIIAIMVLVLFHHSMVYVPEWGFHFKNPIDAPWLASAMVVTSPWRMGLLWLISGISLRYMVDKYPAGEAVLRRTRQILFPLLIGILVVVPPQLFVEMKQANSFSGFYSDFYAQLFTSQPHGFEGFESGIWPSIDVNHLWFLRTLWQVSVVAILMFSLFRFFSASRAFARIPMWISNQPVSLSLVLLFAYTALVDSVLSGNSIREFYGVGMFAVGFLLGKSVAFWHALKHGWHKLTIAAVLSILSVQIGYLFFWQQPDQHWMIDLTCQILYWINKALLPLAVVAIGYRWMNHKSEWFSRMSVKVFPIYILHQTLSILVAYHLTESEITSGMSAGLHMVIGLPIVLVVMIVMLCLIDRVPLLRLCFGQPVDHQSWFDQPLARGIILLCCLPLAMEIIW